MNKIYALIDYKGKWEIIQDKIEEDYDIVVGYIEEQDITDDYLENHVTSCIYYGIPPYIGSDEKLKDRINKLLETYNNTE